MKPMTFKQFMVWTIALLCALLFTLSTDAQTIKKDSKGNYYMDKTPKVKGDSTSNVSTGQTFTDNKGVEYPVYKSKNDKLFIFKTSKTTGSKYRYYLKLT